MEWYKADASLPDHEKVRQLMRLTGWDKHKVIGVLHTFWSSVARLREDGDLTGLQPADIMAYAGLNPRSRVGQGGVDPQLTPGQVLVDLFCSTELIDRNDDGRMVVHGWHERYQPFMTDRFKAKERMRRNREIKNGCSPEPRVVFDGSKQASKQASKTSDADEVFSSWNGLGLPFPSARTMTEKRLIHLRQRMADDFWRENWKAALERIKASAFCRGEIGDRGWIADLDFFLRPDTVTKAIEGKYDNRPLPVDRQIAEMEAQTKAANKAYAEQLMKDGVI